MTQKHFWTALALTLAAGLSAARGQDTPGSSTTPRSTSRETVVVEPVECVFPNLGALPLFRLAREAAPQKLAPRHHPLPASCGASRAVAGDQAITVEVRKNVLGEL